jgi:hypothetical protein
MLEENATGCRLEKPYHSGDRAQEETAISRAKRGDGRSAPKGSESVQTARKRFTDDGLGADVGRRV